MPKARALNLNAMGQHAEEASRLIKELANPQRLRVLCSLTKGELSVGELNEHVELSQSALSQHLARLRAQGLVNTRRDAQTINYSLADGPAKRVMATLYEIYCGKRAAKPKRRKTR